MEMSKSKFCKKKSIKQSVKLTKGQWLPDWSMMQPAVQYSTSHLRAGDVRPTPCLITASPSARLMPRANAGGRRERRRSACVLGGLREGESKIGSWNPANSLSDSSAGAWEEEDLEIDGVCASSRDPYLPRCGG